MQFIFVTQTNTVTLCMFSTIFLLFLTIINIERPRLLLPKPTNNDDKLANLTSKFSNINVYMYIDLHNEVWLDNRQTYWSEGNIRGL